MNAVGRAKCRQCSLAFDYQHDTGKLAEATFESESKAIGFTPRIAAGFYFAAAAVIPVWYFYSSGIYGLQIRDTFGFLWPFGAMPVLGAAICGFLFGAKILDPLVVNGYSSVLLGLMTTGATFLLYLLNFSLFTWIAASVSTNENRTVIDFLYYFVASFFIFTVFGMLAVGWLIAIIGAACGYLLFKVSRLRWFETWLFEAKRMDKRTFRIAAIVLISFFTISWVPYLIAKCNEHEARIDEKRRQERYMREHPPSNTNSKPLSSVN